MSNVITVDFRNDTLFAVERDDGVFVAIKPICDAMGLVWRSQWKRLQNDPVLSQGITVTVIPSVGGAQETTCLKLEMVNGWLFTIDSSRIKDEKVRGKVLSYQRECYQVLFEHFHGKKTQTFEVDEHINESENAKIRLVSECRHIFGTRAAGQLWMKLNLPIVPDMILPTHQLSFIDYANVNTVNESSA